MGKKRIDQVLVEQGFFDSREKAKRAVMAGLVFVGGNRVDKAGTSVDPSLEIEVKGNPLPYVSRGGLKLAKALDTFSVDVAGKIALDIGASTGGFTDCLLQNGAKRVYAIDVGYGQLDWKLRNDPRVVVMERTNVRYLKPEDLPEQGEIATIDVAFISLTKFFEGLLELLTANAHIIALIKPQFEAGREFVGKKGVVRDPQVHIDVIRHLGRELQACGAGIVNLTFSPIRGPEGNIEYLAHFVKGEAIRDVADWAAQVVEEAQNDPQLRGKDSG